MIHDVYCKTHGRPCEDVHRMFYEAMLCCGCERYTAMKMYLAVLSFGPKWDEHGKDIEVSQEGIEDIQW